jgi:hypothetical protein
MRKAILVLGFLLFPFTAFAQHTYYISKSTGLDTRTSAQAQSKTTPWAHLKGMASCTSNCSSYSPVPGDQFILMGCDTWVPSDFIILWDWSGTLANPIVITVDKTWYNTTACPSAWNRPIWDGQNTLTNEFIRASADNTTSYVTLDNIEMKRSAAFNNILSYNPAYGWTMSNLYIHAWDQATDNCRVVQFEAGSPTINLFTNSIIDGSDSTGAAALHSCYAFYPTPPSITNSVIHDLVNPIVGYAGGGSNGSVVTIAGNNIYNVNTSYQDLNHGNAIEIVGSGTYYIYNNLIHHMVCPGCESLMIGNSGETSYVWNNVIWDLGTLGSQAQTPSIPQVSSSGFTEHFWNNTIVATDNQSCVNASGQSASSFTVTVQNTHCIQGSAGSVTDYTAVSPNLEQTAAQASANSSPHFDQYTASETFAYSSLASTNSTVGVGANLTSTAVGAIASLSSDTTYSCTQKTVNGVVQSVCPARTTNARPSAGAWDVGAYQFSSGGSAPLVSLSPTSIAFGGQAINSTSNAQMITLTNTGTATLNITSISLTGANSTNFATLNNTCGATLGVGLNCTIQVTFSPLVVQAYSASLTFTTNAASSPDNVTLTGTGVLTHTITGNGTISGTGTIKTNP